ncbi:Uncharacterised protein [Vibrio cholerae]|nr:Uncharacterised protein [Vibrio cholerae]
MVISPHFSLSKGIKQISHIVITGRDMLCGYPKLTVHRSVQ